MSATTTPTMSKRGVVMGSTVRTPGRAVLAESDIACRRMTAAKLANGLTIEYEVTGDGPPLLLVMGLGAQLIAWPTEFVERLAAKGFTVIRHDNRDIGLSSEIDAPAPSIRRMVLSAISPRFAKSTY